MGVYSACFENLGWRRGFRISRHCLKKRFSKVVAGLQPGLDAFYRIAMGFASGAAFMLQPAFLLAIQLQVLKPLYA